MEKIIFKDGTEITVERNGSCFIVETKPEFPEDLTDITIEGEMPQTIANGRIVDAASVDGRYWFTIIEISEAEAREAKREAQIMYTALMTDTIMEG